jgi:hypothetical protein
MRKKRASCAGKVGVTVSSEAANAPSIRIRVCVFILFILVVLLQAGSPRHF